MPDNSDSTSGGSSRRKVLAAIGGTAVAGGIAADSLGLIPEGEAADDGSDQGSDAGYYEDRPTPAPNENAANPSTPGETSYWPTEKVTVGIRGKRNGYGSDVVKNTGETALKNAIEFWNVYITTNAPFDLTLTYTDDVKYTNDENQANIVFIIDKIGKCGKGEHKTPADDLQNYHRLICADTTTEPLSEDDIPVTASVTQPGSFAGDVTELLLKHGLGRLIGYDIWSEPTHIMTPTIQFGPKTILKDLENTTTLLYTGLEDSNFQRHRAQFNNAHERVIGARTEDLRDKLDKSASIITGLIDRREAKIESDWLPQVEQVTAKYPEFSIYKEAYKQELVNDEFAYARNTVSLINELTNSDKPNDELINDDRYIEAISRLKKMSTWPETKDTIAVQIHRYVTTKLWNEWANNQSTSTSTDTQN